MPAPGAGSFFERVDLLLEIAAGHALDAIEVEAPAGAQRGATAAADAVGKGGPGNGDFHRPAQILSEGVVHRTVHLYGGLQAFYIPVFGRMPLGLEGENAQVDDGIERIDLQFQIIALVPVRVDENFYHLLAPHGIVFLVENGPCIWIVADKGKVKVVVVPQHLGPGRARDRIVVVEDALKAVDLRGGLPGELVQVAVDGHGHGGALHGVVVDRIGREAWLGKQWTTKKHR